MALVLIYFYRVEWEELLPNIITDLLGVALAVFILDTMYRVCADIELKKVLIEKLGSKNNTVASEAAHDLDAQGWLSDGTMKRAFLIGANLDGVSFTGADLRRVAFSFAFLRGTTWYQADLKVLFWMALIWKGRGYRRMRLASTMLKPICWGSLSTMRISTARASVTSNSYAQDRIGGQPCRTAASMMAATTSKPTYPFTSCSPAIQVIRTSGPSSTVSLYRGIWKANHGQVRTCRLPNEAISA